MLGAALQLMGWRELDPGNSPRFPKNLEFVGDDVFLYDIGAALEFLIGTLSQVPKESLIDAQIMEKTRGLESLHNGLIVHLLKLRVGKPAGPLLEELSAAKLLLDRLTSRRYFRPIFRASPGTKEPILQLDADDLADIFTDSSLRYRTEREIEDKAGLPKGTITIHCPKRNTAEKIANVLLTKPAEDGETDPVHPLNEISELDPKTFEKHRVAVKAVEEMYKSMWRLTVYAAPEHMEKWKDISDAAGRAIFEAAGDFNENPCKDRADGSWPNDEHLVSELKRKTDAAYVPPGAESDLSEFGEDLGRTVDRLLGSGRLGPIPEGVYDREAGLTDEGRKRLEAALVAALSGPEEKSVEKSPTKGSGPRMTRVLTTVKIYLKNMKEDDRDSLRQTYSNRIDLLSAEEFDKFASQLNIAVIESKKLEESGAAHKGTKFRQIYELIDRLLDVPVSKRAGSGGDLFGDDGE